jgi:hypothetical protein
MHACCRADAWLLLLLLVLALLPSRPLQLLLAEGVEGQRGPAGCCEQGLEPQASASGGVGQDLHGSRALIVNDSVGPHVARRRAGMLVVRWLALVRAADDNAN